jgi:hypothetical protein
MDRWPTHRPDPGWQIREHQEVVGALLTRAEIADLSELEQAASDLRHNFSAFKEQAISMLSVALAGQRDTFLERQLKQIEELKVTAPGEIAHSLLPGNAWSRDSTAMSQGLMIAPHQVVGAVPMAHRLTIDALEKLGRGVRLSTDHLERVAALGRPKKGARVNIVIAHGRSPLWRDVKDFLGDRLGLPYDEFNRVPVAGIPNSIRLTQMLDGAAFALIVLTGEDEFADGSVRARQNAVHEAGLFQGRLSFARAIVLLEDGCEEFSNIEGLGQIRFPKGNIKAVFEDIRAVLEREGLLKS